MNKWIYPLAVVMIGLTSYDLYHGIKDWVNRNAEEIDAVLYAVTTPEEVYDYPDEPEQCDVVCDDLSDHCSDSCYW